MTAQPMHRRRTKSVAGLMGLASFGLGAIGGALERGWPSNTDPDAVAAFVATHRTAALAQSMAFVLSAAAFVWFASALRGRVVRALAVTWAGLSMVAQAMQIGCVMGADDLRRSSLTTMAAMFAVANLPLAVMLFAHAFATLRTHAFPRWNAWVSIVTGIAQTLLFAGAVVREGPLAPEGWLGYVLYPTFAVWLLATAALMCAGGSRIESILWRRTSGIGTIP